jgi:hypothetical protein
MATDARMSHEYLGQLGWPFWTNRPTRRLRESLRCKGLGRIEEAFQPQGPVLLRPQCIKLFLFQDDVLARTAGDAADDGCQVDRPVHGAVLDVAEALATIRPAPLAVQLLPEPPERGSVVSPTIEVRGHSGEVLERVVAGIPKEDDPTDSRPGECCVYGTAARHLHCQSIP